MPKLKIEYVDIDSVTPYGNNAKLHPAEQIEQIKRSIQEFGFNDPVAVWDNTVVEGHGRLIAAGELGLDKIPVIRLDSLTDAQRRAYGLVHNQLTMNSGFNNDLLEIELDDIDIDLTGYGFEFEDIEINLEDEPEVNDEFDDIERLEKHYGVPYQGNKSRVADIIISILPSGPRLVDLFGGGGAITHCAILSGKWDRFLYNDINKGITTLFVDAIKGKYHNERRVITRADFEANKEEDPYIKYIWSFGNRGGHLSLGAVDRGRKNRRLSCANERELKG